MSDQIPPKMPNNPSDKICWELHWPWGRSTVPCWSAGRLSCDGGILYGFSTIAHVRAAKPLPLGWWLAWGLYYPQKIGDDRDDGRTRFEHCLSVDLKKLGRFLGDSGLPKLADGRMLSEFFELGCTCQKEHVLISWGFAWLCSVQSLTLGDFAVTRRPVLRGFVAGCKKCITKPQKRHESSSLPDPFHFIVRNKSMRSWWFQICFSSLLRIFSLYIF
jgi:hypothetical protein